MDFFKIIDQLAEVDADLLGRFDSRRAIFNSLGSLAKRSAMAASPLLVGALFNKAYAGETGIKSTAVDVLNYALTLELLEQDFYSQVITAGLATSVGGAAAAAAIAKIKLHEDQHVALLGGTSGAIKSLGGTPVSGIRFNASAIPSNLNFATNYDTQLLVAQVLEDTGVRAYKGRASELLGTDLLTTALRIHSMEARHAAHIRYMRATRPGASTDIRPWITAADSAAQTPANALYTSAYTNGITPSTTTPPTPPPTFFNFGGGSFTIPTYDATKPSPREDNTTQSNVALITALGTPYTAAEAAAAFDEYLQPAEVLDGSRAGGLVR
ncbi:ferritin-like domain-containing protein [Hymenobacter rubidus]|uniref:ferritin-like domain-containing protein n=1 Tax=Hymenobacter rubidus TaxID=1441626 RepID=UPI00191F1CF6|nr:ferritin-like domain-containing protein [Hymenobacter rubidus]